MDAGVGVDSFPSRERSYTSWPDETVCADRMTSTSTWKQLWGGFSKNTIWIYSTSCSHSKDAGGGLRGKSLHLLRDILSWVCWCLRAQCILWNKGNHRNILKVYLDLFFCHFHHQLLNPAHPNGLMTPTYPPVFGKVRAKRYVPFCCLEHLRH